MQIDKVEIAEKVCAFAWRDQQRWDDLRAIFADGATISVSWFEGSIDKFIQASKQMAIAGEAQTKHWFGPPRSVVRGDRALAETDVMIMIRSRTGPLEVDITAYARFVDRFERDADRGWLIRSRVAVYEKDRMDPVGPSILIWFLNLIAPYKKYPPALKHLAFGLSRKGRALVPGTISSGSVEEQAFLKEAQKWLDKGS